MSVVCPCENVLVVRRGEAAATGIAAARYRRRRPEWQVARCAAVLALNTTMRGCELKALRWKDIDLFQQTLTVGRSKDRSRPSAPTAESRCGYRARRNAGAVRRVGRCGPRALRLSELRTGAFRCHTTNEELAYGLAKPHQGGRPSRPAVPRSEAYRDHRAIRAGYLRHDHHVDCRACFLADAGALLAHSAGSKTEGVRRVGRAREGSYGTIHVTFSEKDFSGIH
jgi:integrase